MKGTAFTSERERVRMLLSLVAHAVGYKMMVGAHNTVCVRRMWEVLPYVVIGCGLALNDTGVILVQATCPTSSFTRLVTLFLSPGARSLLWGKKRVGIKRGVLEVRSGSGPKGQE